MKDLPKILISVIHQGWVRPELAQLIPVLLNNKYKPTLYFSYDKPYQSSLNRVRKKVLDEGFDYWINFDDDNVPMKDPLKLIELDKDIIGMPYMVWKPDYDDKPNIGWLVMNKTGEYEYRQVPIDTRKGLKEVDAVGSGAMVIARRVLKDLYFEREYDKDGIQVQGIDFNFCKKAKEKGFKVWAHWDYPAEHYVETPMNNILGIK